MKRTTVITVAIAIAALILAAVAVTNMARKRAQVDDGTAPALQAGPPRATQPDSPPPPAVLKTDPPPGDSVAQRAAVAEAAPASAARLPRLLDLGADKCVPCKMMAPILEQLRKEYAGTFAVEFIDVWKNPDAAKKHGVLMIPTQIFLDAAGNEQFRHEGFFSKADILRKWRELGVNVSAPAPAAPPQSR